MNKRKKILLSIIGILLLVLATVGVTVALFTYTRLGTTENTITTGTLKFLYTENTGVGNGISMTNAFPVADDVGKEYDTENYVFDFKVEATNSGTEVIPYEVTLRKKSGSTLAESNVKVYLTDMTGDADTELVAPTLYSNLTQTSVDVGTETEMTLYNGTVPGGENNYEKDFRLRMWLDEKANYDNIAGKTFTALVNVYSNVKVVDSSIVYTDPELNGADPVLKNNLVPVVIGNDGTVRKANTNSEWYNYADKRWANAVILKDEGVSYTSGQGIPEDNIESYFVWIPRYKYKLFDLGNYDSLTQREEKQQEIEIVFESKEVSASNGTTVGDYLTHPAFTSFDSNGMWVGKFETGYDGATTPSDSRVNSVDTNKIIIKPNVYSWRSMAIGNMFKNSYDYQRNLDSHMMKNTEWGAVAYLSHSKYGINEEIRINNNRDHITGYSATEKPTKGYNSETSIEGNRIESTVLGVDGTHTINYLNPASVISSTTGNYSGIYDVNGGVWEYTMGYMTSATTEGGASEITTLYPDFFNDPTYTKYWDKYTSTTTANFNNRILGDATGEMGPFYSNADGDGVSRPKSSWYDDVANFPNSSYSWFNRGGNCNYGSSAGIFTFSSLNGGGYIGNGFRIVLTPST